MCTRLNCLRLIPRPKPSILRLRHSSIHLRRYQVRGLNGCRDCLETRTSRPRPHSWSSVLWPRIYGFLRWFPWRAISRASALTLLGDRKGIRPAKTGCWFVGDDDLIGALHDLWLQLSPPPPSFFASVNTG